MRSGGGNDGGEVLPGGREPGSVRALVRRHRVAYGLFLVLFVAWGAAIPMGEVQSHVYQWYLDEWPVDGRPVHVVGATRYSAQGWGMPAGTIIRGENTLVAEQRTDSGLRPIAITEALKREVLTKFPDSAGTEGWALSLGNVIPPPPVLVLFLFGMTCAWWTGLSAWRWSPERSWIGNSLTCSAWSVWPWLVLTASGWALRDLRVISTLTELLIPPEVAIAGTAFVLAFGLAFFVARRRTSSSAD